MAFYGGSFGPSPASTPLLSFCLVCLFHLGGGHVPSDALSSEFSRLFSPLQLEFHFIYFLGYHLGLSRLKVRTHIHAQEFSHFESINGSDFELLDRKQVVRKMRFSVVKIGVQSLVRNVTLPENLLLLTAILWAQAH